MTTENRQPKKWTAHWRLAQYCKKRFLSNNKVSLAHTNRLTAKGKKMEETKKEQKATKVQNESAWKQTALEVGLQALTMLISGFAFGAGTRASNSLIDRVQAARRPKVDPFTENLVSIKRQSANA